MSFAVNYHRWILDCFAPYLRGNVAEVGAGIGSVSSLLLERPHDSFIAFEPSRNMFPYLGQSLEGVPNARAINDFFNPALVPQGLDSIVYINVLEHIEDDAAEIKRAYASLRPQGHLLVFVPAMPFLYSKFDRDIGHYRRYTKAGLNNLVNVAGFDIEKLHYFDVAGILPWYVSFVLMKGSPRSAQVALYDRWVVPIMRRLETLLSPPIGKNLLLVARKP